jgi:LuxR family maltose regulon positive regulatory protein
MESNSPRGDAGGRASPSFEPHYERVRLAPDLLRRDRLTRTLAAARNEFVLLAAPPGFGKTTLLHQWRAADERPFAYVALEPADNEPVLFWTRIFETVRELQPGFDSATQIALRAPQADIPGTVVPLFAHDLHALDGDLVLALDDYQAIQNRIVHDSVALFLNWLPANVTLALSTRADPPLPIGRLRANGELVELRAVDLCFTEDEEAALLNGTLGLGLPREAVGVLHERTEGWPAGVHLACLSLRKADDPVAFATGFSGSNRHVVDYLTEVVLEGLEERPRRFLLDVSILESVCASLADALSGERGSADILDELEHANLFLVQLDERREWYRFHSLFLELLRGRLRRENPGRLPELHRRASDWYAEAGLIEDAIRHAVAAGDVSRGVELAAIHWAPRLDVANARRTLALLGALDDEAVGGDARLLLARAWAAGVTAGDGVEALAAARQTGLDGRLADGTPLEAAAAVIESLPPGHDVGAALAAVRRVEAFEDELGSAWQAPAQLGRGWAVHLAGEPEDAGAPLEQAVAGAAESGDAALEVVARSVLAQAALRRGEPDAARRMAHAALEVLREGGSTDPRPSGLARAAHGAALAEKDSAAAERELEQALAHLRAFGAPMLVAEALLALAPVRRESSGVAAGRECVEEARRILADCPDPGALADRLEDVARTLTPAYRRADGDSELTERELEVLRYLAEGLPKRDIATTLFVSYNTIHSHTKSIYHKLRVSSRQAAIEKARELGAL